MRGEKTRRFLTIFVGVLFLLTMVPLACYGEVPNLINYQGKLTDATTGDPIDEPTGMAMTFRIYATETGGLPLWEEDHTAVIVGDGVYNVLLGSGTTNPSYGTFDPDLFHLGDPSHNRWLEVVIGEGDGAEVLGPRQQVTSVAFASQAEVAAYAYTAGDADTLDALDSTDLNQSAHVADTGNPHNVTAAQVGAVPLDRV